MIRPTVALAICRAIADKSPSRLVGALGGSKQSPWGTALAISRAIRDGSPTQPLDCAVPRRAATRTQRAVRRASLEDDDRARRAVADFSATGRTHLERLPHERAPHANRASGANVNSGEVKHLKPGTAPVPARDGETGRPDPQGSLLGPRRLEPLARWARFRDGRLAASAHALVCPRRAFYQTIVRVETRDTRPTWT